MTQPDTHEKTRKEAIQAYQSALDDMVSVNGLFTVAVFLGLTFSKNLNLQKNPKCKLSDDDSVARRLLVNEVVSFSCFLLSSLVAKALKSYLSAYSLNLNIEIDAKLQKFIRGVMLSLSAWGSIFGCIFLTISMVDVIRMRLGKITCGHEAKISATCLIGIVSLALVIYIPFSMQAVYSTMKRFEEKEESKEGETSEGRQA